MLQVLQGHDRLVAATYVAGALQQRLFGETGTPSLPRRERVFARLIASAYIAQPRAVALSGSHPASAADLSHFTQAASSIAMVLAFSKAS